MLVAENVANQPPYLAVDLDGGSEIFQKFRHCLVYRLLQMGATFPESFRLFLQVLAEHHGKEKLGRDFVTLLDAPVDPVEGLPDPGMGKAVCFPIQPVTEPGKERLEEAGPAEELITLFPLPEEQQLQDLLVEPGRGAHPRLPAQPKSRAWRQTSRP